MPARFIQSGATIDYTPAAAVAASDVVVIGDLIGIAPYDIAPNKPGVLQCVGDVFDFDAVTGAGTDSTIGTKYYYDAATKLATEDAASGANKYLGLSILPKTTAQATVRILKAQ